jgi:hypothetical protein
MHREKIEKNQRNFFFVEMHKKTTTNIRKTCCNLIYNQVKTKHILFKKS